MVFWKGCHLESQEDLNTPLGSNDLTQMCVNGKNILPGLNFVISLLWQVWYFHNQHVQAQRDSYCTCTWYQATLGQRLMITFVILSSDMGNYVLDAHVKRRAEMSASDYEDTFFLINDINQRLMKVFLIKAGVRCFGPSQNTRSL